MAQYERMLELYESGQVPWDRAEPPPEVMAIAPTLPVGRALDLGCGLGRASLYLAHLGWEVDGIDFVAQAVEEAAARALRSGLSGKARFHLAAVDQLEFLAGPYDFALDVGCAHNFSAEQLRRYHAGLLRLLRTGAIYLLFAHLNDDAETAPERRRWIEEVDLRTIFSDGFTLDRVEYGQTQVGEQAPWRSAWFWFRRSVS